RSMTTGRGSGRAAEGAAAIRSGGSAKSKSAVCNRAALRNPLYKQSFLAKNIPFSSPHDDSQGAFFRWDGVSGALPLGPGSGWVVLSDAPAAGDRRDRRRGYPSRPPSKPDFDSRSGGVASSRQAQHEDQGRHRDRISADRDAGA